MARSVAAARPRPRARPSSGTTIHWQKVGRLALLFTLFVIVLLYIRPVAHWIQQRSTAAHSQADLRALQRENARLEARLRQLSGTGAIEREARKMGMVRRGERPYAFVPWDDTRYRRSAVAYAIENALFQWEEGEARIRDASGGEARDLDRAARLVVEALRRRLGGSFTLGELADLYGEGTDWVRDEVQSRFTDVQTSAAVDAGFLRYARSASDYAGGRRRVLEEESG